MIALLIGTLAGCTDTQTNDDFVTIHFPSDRQLTIRNSPTLALSPDGKWVVYPADTVNGDRRQLYIQPVDGQVGRLLEGTDDGETPFFSPDGLWVGFFADGKLKTVSIDNSLVVVLSDAPNPLGGYWTVDDTIVYSTGSVWMISANGGTPRQLTRKNSGEQHHWPMLMPGGKQVMYNLLEAGKNEPGIVIEEFDSGQRWNVIESGSYPRYTADRYLVYTEAGLLKVADIDLTTHTLRSNPVTVLEDVLMSPQTGAAQYDLSANGQMVYIAGGIFGRSRRVVMFDQNGNERDPGLPLGRYSYARYSPDGKYLAVEVQGEQSTIRVHDLEQKSSIQLISDGQYPVWTPDGKNITYSTAISGVPGIYQVPVNNPNAVEELVLGNYPVNHSYAWSADGKILTYTELNPDSGMDIWMVDPSGPSRPEPISNTPAQECCPIISSDNRWLAYVTDESGRPEVYIKTFPDLQQTYRLSSNGGREPIWSQHGVELYYWQDRQLMAVDLADFGSTGISNPRALIEGVFVSSTSTWRPRYDINAINNDIVIIRRGPEELGVMELKQVIDFNKLLPNLP